jgi:thiol-disulfide isomerase/thioredoxin
VLLAAAVVIALVLILLYVSLSRRREAFEQPWSTLVFLHMDGCGWCERFKPVWKDFVATYGGALTAAHVRAVDVEAASPEMAQYREHVAGYPTILFADGDSNVVKFSGDRTKAGLVAFLREQGVSLKEGFLGQPAGEPPRRVTTGADTIRKNAGEAIENNSNGPDGKIYTDRKKEMSQVGFKTPPPPATYTPKQM